METLTSLSFLDLFFRWGHVMFGIIWLGMLFFFNLVNIPFQAELDPALKAKVNPGLLLRAVWWFRWGAMYTFIFGLALFVLDYVHPGHALRSPEGGMTGRGMWIMFGMTLGIVMWFNVWFVIWPRQKLIMRGLLTGQPHPDAAKLAGTMAKASRFNLFASGPLLFGMLGAQHLGAMSTPALLAVVFLGVGFWFGMIKRSFKIKPVV